MARTNGQVNLSAEKLEQLLLEQEALNHALRDQVRALEEERDGALRGLEIVTEGLRRRGCCDHDTSSGAL